MFIYKVLINTAVNYRNDHAEKYPRTELRLNFKYLNV